MIITLFFSRSLGTIASYKLRETLIMKSENGNWRIFYYIPIDPACSAAIKCIQRPRIRNEIMMRCVPSERPPTRYFTYSHPCVSPAVGADKMMKIISVSLSTREYKAASTWDLSINIIRATIHCWVLAFPCNFFHLSLTSKKKWWRIKAHVWVLESTRLQVRGIYPSTSLMQHLTAGSWSPLVTSSIFLWRQRQKDEEYKRMSGY